MDRPSEPAVNSACGGGTAHRFTFQLPSYAWGANIRAIGTDLSGNSAKELSRSPKPWVLLNHHQAKGFLGQIPPSGVVSGWSCDPDAPTLSNQVWISDLNTNRLLAIVDANQPSGASVSTACGGGTHHGFAFALPASAQGQSIRATGTDATLGAAGGDLSGSPRTWN